MSGSIGLTHGVFGLVWRLKIPWRPLLRADLCIGSRLEKKTLRNTSQSSAVEVDDAGKCFDSARFTCTCLMTLPMTDPCMVYIYANIWGILMVY